MIDIPEEFYVFGQWMHQDVMELAGPLPEDWILYALGHVNSGGQPKLLAFLDSLLDANLSEHELMRIYRSTDADVSPRGEDGARKFFCFMRDALRDGRVS